MKFSKEFIAGAVVGAAVYRFVGVLSERTTQRILKDIPDLQKLRKEAKQAEARARAMRIKPILTIEDIKQRKGLY
jgi:hypothetical protein